MSVDFLLLAVHALATIAMAGLIWFVQVVHYPLFREVGPGEFARYERLHQQRTTRIVAPLMLIELASALLVVFRRVQAAGDLVLPAAGLVLLIAIWLSTFLVQVPLHAALEDGPDDRLIRRLVATNWVRTAAWSARAVIAVILLLPGPG